MPGGCGRWKSGMTDQMGANGTDTNVVSIFDYKTDQRYPPVSEVEAYWDALRGPSLVPFRSEIDPRGIERSLEYAFIAERIAPGMARFRLAGHHLSDLMGMDVRGMPVTSFFTPAGRTRVKSVLEEVFEGPAKATLTLNSETGIGKPAIEARLLLLPLKSDLGDISRALGCLVAHGSIGRTPRRFDVAQIQRSAIGTPETAITRFDNESSEPQSEPETTGPRVLDFDT